MMMACATQFPITIHAGLLITGQKECCYFQSSQS